MKKRADGRYCKQILIGYKDNGSRIMKTIYGKTIKEVEVKERELRNNISNGINVIQENVTVGEWGIKWLDVYKSKKSSNTYQMYQNSLEKHIIPSIGSIPITKLKAIQIQTVLNSLIDKGQIRTAEIFRLTINQIIEQAVNQGIVVKNVCDGLDKITPKQGENRVLNDFEQECIKHTHYTDKEKIFLNILYCTGIRRGECLALSVADIDVKDNLLRVGKSLDINKKCPELKTPKSDAGYRYIPLPQWLVNDLVSYISRIDSIYLFTMRGGKLMSKSSFRRMWESILKKTVSTAKKIRATQISDTLQLYEDDLNFTPHVFRHTYATNLYYAGIDIKQCQYLMGHNSLDITLSIYTHLNQKNNEDTSAKIKKIFEHSAIA